MKVEDRVTAIAEFGFTERQARFLDVVMLFGGLCVPRQYATFAGTAYGHSVSRFFDTLVQRGYATVCDCLHNRAALYHVRHPKLYRAIDQPHSRYRRPVPARQVTDRLMRLDAIVLQPGLRWLATEDEKVAFFSLMTPSLARERLPHVMVGQGGGVLRLFPDDQPIGVATTGRVVFSYLSTVYETEADATAPLGLERLAVLTPRPRVNLILYYGVLAPRSAWRRAIVPRITDGADAREEAAAEDEDASCPRPSRAGAYQWAELMRRTFGVDVLACTRCSGRLRLVALIEQACVVQRILRHLGLPTEVPEPRPARSPPRLFHAPEDQVLDVSECDGAW